MSAATIGRKTEEVRPCRYCGRDVDLTPPIFASATHRTRRDYHAAQDCLLDEAQTIGERRANGGDGTA